MKYKIILWMLAAILLISTVSADFKSDHCTVHFTLDDLTDQCNSNDGTRVNDVVANSAYAEFNVTGDSSPNSSWFDGTNDEITFDHADTYNDGVTISVWINDTLSANNDFIFYTDDGVDQNTYNLRIDAGTEKLRFRKRISGSWKTDCVGTTDVANGKWNHIVATERAGSCYIYVNGAQQATAGGWSGSISVTTQSLGTHSSAQINDYDGHLDHFYLFDEPVNLSMVHLLYNEGNPTPPAPATSLSQTYDTTFYETQTIWHTLNFTNSLINISAVNNASLWWDGNNYQASIQNQTQGFISFNVSLNTDLLDDNATLFAFNWTYNVSINDEFILNTTTLLNQTGLFYYDITNVSMSTNVTETATEVISFNVLRYLTTPTVNNYTIFLNNSLLFYNDSASQYGLNNSYVVPFMSSDLSTALEPASLNFTITHNTKTVSRGYDLTINVSSTALSTCALGTPPDIILLLKDEINTATPENGSIDLTALTWVTTKANNRTFSFDLGTPESVGLCFNLPGNFFTEAIITHSGTNKVIRNYFILNSTFSGSTTNNITLYNLLDNLSNNIIVKVTDSNDDALSEHFVELIRYYEAEDEYRTVEISRTDVNGEALIHAIPFNVFYQMVIKDINGRVLKVTNPSKIVQSTINLQVSPDDDFIQLLEKVDSINKILTFNNNTRIVTFFYSDSENIVQNGELLVTKITPRGNTILCNDQAASVTSTLTCNLENETGQLYIEGRVRLSNGQLVPLSSLNDDSSTAELGQYGILLYLISLMVCAGAALFHPAAGIIISFLVTLAFVVVGVLPLSYASMMMIALLGVIVLVRLRT